MQTYSKKTEEYLEIAAIYFLPLRLSKRIAILNKSKKIPYRQPNTNLLAFCHFLIQFIGQVIHDLGHLLLRLTLQYLDGVRNKEVEFE